MYRAQSRMKKSLQEKWNSRVTELHVERLNNARPCVDMRNPSNFRHLFKKCKKEQLLEGTYHSISRG